MSLSENNFNLLKEVVSHGNIKSVDLIDMYELSRRQIDYSFIKINQWLQMNNLPEITRTSQGYFLVDPIIKSLISEDMHKIDITQSTPTAEERKFLILLMLLSANEELSLQHFTQQLKVSKNTVLTDLKAVKTIINFKSLSLIYSRISGYQIEGKEFDIRRLLLQVVQNILEITNGRQWFVKVTNTNELSIQEIYITLEQVEIDLGLKFTDEKIKMLPYYLSVLFQRVSSKKYVDHFPVRPYELSDTKEYQAAGKLLLPLGDIPLEERMFITLKLLATNVSASSFIEDIVPELRISIKEMISNFEKITMITVKNKDLLLNQLLTHMRPAYYRIVYRLTTENHLQTSVGQEFDNLRHLVKRSAKPLEIFLKTQVSSEEITYLTMIVGGWLAKQGDSILGKTTAIIVCPNGVSVSKHLNTTLSSLFPEFIFMDTLSIREFYHYKRVFQVVFSPTFLETNQHLFIVNPFLDAKQKRHLRKRVLEQINGVSPLVVDQEELLSLIKKHATIHDEQALTQEIMQYIQQEDAEILGMDNERSPSIMDLLKEDQIIFRNRVKNLGEAINIATEPLLKKQYIDQNYIDAMMNLHDVEDPYAVLGKYIAIPHARVEDGVHQLGVSILKLENGLKISEDIFLHLVVVILPDENGNHLKALQQLEHIASNNSALISLKNQSTIAEFRKELHYYTEKKE